MYTKLIRNIITFATFFLFSSQTVCATTYYVSSAGNDSNSGTTESSPWKTLSKVNNSQFNPGDQILFKAGDVWTENKLSLPSSGDSSQDIFIGRYGSGVNPAINSTNQYEAILIRNKSHLTIDGLDIIKAGSDGYAIYNSNFLTIRNVKVTNVGALSGAFIFATCNPNDCQEPVDNGLTHDITVEDFQIEGGGSMGWAFSGNGIVPIKNITLRRGTINNAGQAAAYQTHGMYISSWQNFLIEDVTITNSWNAGIKIVSNTNNGIFRRIKIFDSGRSGSSGPGVSLGDSNSDRAPYIHDLKFENCVIARSKNQAFWNIDGLDSVKSITIDHCTLVNNVGSINFKNGSTNWTIKNTIGYEDTNWNNNTLRNPLMWESETNISRNTLENNLWYFKNGNSFHDPVKINNTTLTFSSWISKGNDTNSLSVDPLLNNNNYPTYSSLACLPNNAYIGAYPCNDSPGSPSPSPIPSDYNNDGLVNGADYTIFLAGFGTKYTLIDYATLLANYGK